MEKIKMLMVVHPGSCKFMEFLLRLINFVLKEHFNRTKSPKNVSFDLNLAVKKHQEMVTIMETLNNDVRNETMQITERNQKIDKLLYENYFVVNGQSVVDETNVAQFISDWHSFNKKRTAEIQGRTDRMNQLTKLAKDTFEKFETMLKPKNHEIVYDPVKIEEVMSFLQYNLFKDKPEIFENYKIDSRVSFISLIKLLELTVPDIISFIQNFNCTNSEATKYEISEVEKLCTQVSQVASEIGEFKQKYLGGDGTNVETVKENGAQALDPDLQMKNYSLGTPKLAIDLSANCVENPTIINKKHRLPLLSSATDSPMNRTKLFRLKQIDTTPSSKNNSFNSSTIAKKTAEKSGPADESIVFTKPPSRRRNARQIFEKATSSKNLPASPKSAPTKFNQLSSTMLSPDRRLFENPNFSGISNISRISTSSISPGVEDTNTIQTIQRIKRNQLTHSPHSATQNKCIISEMIETSTTLVSPDSIIFNRQSSINSVIHLSRNSPGTGNLSTAQLSPSGKLSALVLHENLPKIEVSLCASFENELENVSIFNLPEHLPEPILLIFSFSHADFNTRQ